MERRYSFIIMLLLAFQSFQLFAQVDSEFWFVVPEITWQHSTDKGEPTFLRIASVGDSVLVTIEMPALNTILAEILVPAGEYRSYDLTQFIRLNYNPAFPATGVTNDPNRGDYDDNNIIESGLPGTEGIINQRGLRIWSRGINAFNRNTDITVYCDRFNFNNKDIWSLKGRNGMGTLFTIPSQNTEPNVGYGSDPMALNAFDIVATEDATTVTITPKQRIRHSGFVPNYYEAGDDIVITLNKGETFSCVAMTRVAGAHLGGSFVASNNPIAITLKDDSLRPNDDNGYDTAGDQLIPDRLAGLEFVVMRGELDDDEEYAYIMSTESGTTTVTHSACPLGTTNTITLSGRGDIKAIQMNNFGAGTCDIDALLIESDQKILVWHITGFGNEVGGGLIPSIDLCTGSKDVTIVRSSSAERFFLTLMTKEDNRDDFSVYIDVNGDGSYGPGETFTFVLADFAPAGATGWYYLTKAANEFTNNGDSPFGQSIIAGRPTRITNTGRFHLGTIEGGGSGCKYGYFSSFSADTGSATIGIDAKGIERYCFGDTIDLKATGAVSYEWWYDGSLADNNNFLTATDIEDPLAILTPGSSIWEVYKVRIEKDCYDGASAFDTLDVEVQVYQEVDADYDTVPLSPNCCSPTDYNFAHTMDTYTNHIWSIPRETDTLNRTFSTTSSPDLYSEDVLFTNASYSPIYYNVEHVVHKNYLCYDTIIKPIKVNPNISAAAAKGPKAGCQQDVLANYTIDTVDRGPITSVYWNWGDGQEEEILQSNIVTLDFSHNFQNLTNIDILYYVTLVYIDSVNNCRDTLDAPFMDTVFVPGVARARFSLDKRNGCSPLDVTLSNHSNGDITYEWWINDTHDFTGAADRIDNFVSDVITLDNDLLAIPKEYYVYLKITKLNDDLTICEDTYGPDTVTVYPEFTTTISPAGLLEGCNPYTVDFSQTTVPNVPNLQYEWDFGDGTTSGLADPLSKEYSHLESVDKVYPVTLTTTSEFNCPDIATPTDVTVYAYVDAKFTVAPDTVGCSPFTVTLNNNTSINSVKDFTWDLDGGVGVTNDIAPFNVVYTNNGDLPVVQTITLTNDNPHICPVTFSKEITVNPEITAQYNISASPICNKESITFTNTSIFTGTSNPIPGASATYLWDFGDGTTDATESPTHLFTNTENNGILAQQFTITLTIIVNDCPSTVQQIVSVYPEVIPQFNSDKYSVCESEILELRNESLGATNYVWSFTDSVNNRSVANTNPIYHKFINADPENKIPTTVTLTASNGTCSYDIQKVYTVYPTIVPVINPSELEFCAPQNVTFTNESTGGSNLTYVWNFNDGTPTSSEENPVHEFVNRTSGDLTSNVTLQVENEIGCSNNTNVDIIVSPEVVADFTFTQDDKCTSEFTFVNNSTTGTQFLWDFDDGQSVTTIDVSEDATNVFVRPPDNNTIVYNVTLTAEGSYNTQCNDAITIPVTVYPVVVAALNVPVDTACSPFTPVIENNSLGYQINSVWHYGNDNNSPEYENRGTADETYPITLTVIDGIGCDDVATGEFTAHPLVVADFTFLKDDICTPFPVTFNYPSTALNGDRWDWNFGEVGNDTVDRDKITFTHNFDNVLPNAIETYTITLYAIDEATTCDSLITKEIEVYPRLVPGFDADVIEGCNPLTVDFTNETTGLANYNWNFKDGQSSALTGPEHIFSHLNSENSETYLVELTTVQENTGCSKTVDTTITVYSYVKAEFGLAKIDATKGLKADEIVGGCHPFDVEIIDSSKTNATWAWAFGDGETGDTQQPGIRKYFNTDQTAPLQNAVYEVKLQVTNTQGCFDRDSAQLEVYPSSAPAFNVDNEGCHPHSVSFLDESVVDSDTKYYWTLGDGSSKVVSNFDYTYTNYSYTDIATYSVTLNTTTSYGCPDEVTQVITVYPKPLADFVPELDRDCPPFETSLVNSSEGTNITFFWDFDNDETKEIREKTTEHPIYYNNSAVDEILEKNPSLIVVSEYGCEDTVIVPIYIFPAVSVGLMPSITEGCSPLVVDFTNTSNRSAKVFTWSFGDGNTSGLKHPSHTYFNETVDDQIYVVNLYAESDHGCNNEFTDTITVYLTPLVDFDAQDPVQFFPDDSVWFTNLTQPGPWTYTWLFGNNDQSNRTDPKFLYTYGTWAPNEDDNIFEVTLIAASDFCTDTMVHNVKIIPPVPIISIEQVTPGEGCVPLQVTFDITQQYSNSFLWEFGNGDVSVEAEPVYIFNEPGIFNVKLTATGDGGSWFDYSVVGVYALPEPDFKVSPDFVMLPDQEIQIYNLTLNGATYDWYFGDGGTSHTTDPSYLYTEEGSYDITLVAYSVEGCVDSLEQEAAAYVSGEGTIAFPNAFLPNDMSPSDGSYVTPDVDNEVFHPVHSGISRYELWIFNRWGEQIFYSDDIEKGWNGKMGNNGKRLGQDVYFWKSQGKFENGVPFDKAGDVTIIIR